MSACDNSKGPAEGGFDAKAFLRTLTQNPGVYRMLDAEGGVLYVGKARNLKRRVSSYFRETGQSLKTRALMRQMHSMEVTVTHTESEALILENTLIKEHRPRYNILLRDDKSYPYLFVSTEDEYPRLTFHRGARRAKGRYFGPYPNAYSARESMNLLQKVFRVRQCEDSFFRNRSRPCLQYQIERCTGPCVAAVSVEDYAADVRDTMLFLDGKSSELIDQLAARMEQAAEQLDYEQAAKLRDQIIALRRVQERQYVSGEAGDLDIVAGGVQGGVACIQVFFIRAGRNLGNKLFFPKTPDGATGAELLTAFIPQYYLGKQIPSELLLSEEPEEAKWLQQVLAEQAGRKVSLSWRVRGERARWLGMARNNANHALTARLATQAGMTQRLESLQQAMDLDEAPTRMECFDISHTQGEATVASCVVFGAEGPLKSDYRRFNIEGIQAGDDYAAMQQALRRRYTRLMEGEGKLPDILFIDGGKGQVSAACAILEELQVSGVQVVGVAKGPERRAGMELLVVVGQGELRLPSDSPGLHLIQQIRDEAHRFAITGHRQRRGRKRKQSPLEAIPGVGPKRRQELLKQFGGLRELERAGVEDLCRVKGINRALAQQIYDAFHGDAAS